MKTLHVSRLWISHLRLNIRSPTFPTFVRSWAYRRAIHNYEGWKSQNRAPFLSIDKIKDKRKHSRERPQNSIFIPCLFCYHGQISKISSLGKSLYSFKVNLTDHHCPPSSCLTLQFSVFLSKWALAKRFKMHLIRRNYFLLSPEPSTNTKTSE